MSKSDRKVKIIWGSDQDEENLKEYEFDTKEEYFAFMKGVDESNGWLEYSDIGDWGNTFFCIEEWREHYGK